MPCLLCYDIAEIEALRLSRINMLGTCFTSLFSIFSVKARWIAQKCFSCFSLLTLLCNGQYITEYEAYWLMDVPIINLSGGPSILSFKAVCTKLTN